MIATTIEQSKRLLAAGIDPMSCDMLWTNEVEEDKGFGIIVTRQEEEYHLEFGQPFFDFPDDPSIPAWSMACLWNIMKDAGLVYEYDTTLSAEEVIRLMVLVIVEKFKKL